MWILLLAMQLPPPPPSPPPSPAAPAPPPAAPAPLPAAAVPPPAVSTPAAPPLTPPSAPAAPPPIAPPYRAALPPPDAQREPAERDVSWFVRIDVGLGPRGFAENNALLEQVGYGGVKMWATLDGAWMFHRHVGAGLWMGMNRLSSTPQSNPIGRLNEVSYFIGGQLPILLWGARAYAFHATPRVAFASGQLDIAEGESAAFQHTGMFGGALSFQSFSYHVGSSISLMHAPAGEPGEIGRGHDYGGLYFTISGTLDG